MGNAPNYEKMNTLEAILEHTGDSVEVQWVDKRPAGETWDGYDIPLSKLTRNKDAILEALANLESTNWDDKSEATLSPKLQSLARAGQELYNTLMEGDLEDKQSRITAAKFREWFEKTVAVDPDNWRIQFVHQQYNAPIIPWGLVFSPLPDDKTIDALKEGVDDYYNFWALSYKLACSGIMRHESKKIPGRIDEAQATVALTLEVGDDVIEYYKKDRGPAAASFADENVAYSLNKFDEIARSVKKFNVFWYFSLEADNSKYLLNGEELGDTNIGKTHDHIDEILILFLDGGAVIRSKDGARWLDAALQIGRSGVIVAETDITNPQLKHVGWKVMKKLMVAETPLIGAMDKVRRELWPKSLFYGVYCDPLHIYFEPPPTDNIKAADAFLESVRSFGSKADN